MRIPKNKIIGFIGVLLVALSCDEQPGTYVGDTELTTNAVIRGTVIDSTSGETLPDVKVSATEIVAHSDFLEIDYTDMNGEFVIDSVFKEQFYYLSFKTTGYLCKDILVEIEDSLIFEKPISLSRLKFPYKEIPVTQFPADSTAEGFYYRLESESFTNDQSWYPWFKGYQNEDDYLKGNQLKVDSVLISLLRSGVKPDTTWFKYYQSSCGQQPVSFDPVLVVRISEENPQIMNKNFEPYDFSLDIKKSCIDSTEQILKYSYFYE